MPTIFRTTTMNRAMTAQPRAAHVDLEHEFFVEDQYATSGCIDAPEYISFGGASTRTVGSGTYEIWFVNREE